LFHQRDMIGSHDSIEISMGGVTIRRLGDDDLPAAGHLARLDSRDPLQGPLLGAEVEGRILAAISIATREVVADPFSSTAELRALLELRAAQLRRRENGRRQHWLHRPRVRASVALGGSPPGAPGWLMRRDSS